MALRNAIFVIGGILTGIPLFHLCYLYFNSDKSITSGEGLLVCLIHGVVYIVGAIILSLRYPEKKFPKKFDNFGASHQIWHVFVVTAISLNFYASILFYRARSEEKCLNDWKLLFYFI